MDQAGSEVNFNMCKCVSILLWLDDDILEVSDYKLTCLFTLPSVCSKHNIHFTR